MIPLDQYEKWQPRLKECARLYLNEKEYRQYEQMSDYERNACLKRILEKPVASFTIINEVYFRARWAEVIGMFHPQADLTLLEVASGDADMIPQTMARNHPNSRYITANMNKLLNESLLKKTNGLALNVQLIDDDAANIANYLGSETVDVAAFQHSINDVLQAILCEREGVDTIYSDWMETLPKMIEILQKEIAQGSLEGHVKMPFLNLLLAILKVLKKDGIIVMNHYMFQLDLDWGYPEGLFENMIPMVREWIAELAGCKEVFYDGFDRNWWIFLQKN